MKSYLELVGQYGRVHKKKNRITILCIAVSVCLVVAIFGIADMFVRAQIIGQIKSSGNWHLGMRDIDDETAGMIGSRVDVAFSGRMQRTGDGTLEGKPLGVIGGDEAISEQIGLSMAEGRFPQGPGEALLDRQAMEDFGYALGDRVTVTLSDGSSCSFIIVGIFNDLASLKKDDAHGLFLSVTGVRGIAGQSDTSIFYVQFKKGIDMRKAIDEIKENYGLREEQVSENTALMALAGQSLNSWVMQLYKTAAVMFLLVLAAGILMIASSFNMSVLERIQFFGLLRCMGATRKQVRRYVIREGIYLSLKGIPAGLLMGTAVVWVSCAFLKYVNSAYFEDMPLFAVSLVSLFSGVAVGFITVILASLSPCRKAAGVPPICAVTGNVSRPGASQSKVPAGTARVPVDVALGIHHAFAGKKNILFMIGSYAISIVLFLSFSVLVDFMHQALRPLRPYTPDISIVSGNNTTSLDAGLLEQLKGYPEVKRAYGRMFAYDVPAAAGKEKGKINLISYEENQFRWAEKELVQGSLEEVERGEDSVLAVYSEDLKWQLGDTLTLELPTGNKTVKLAGLLSSSPFSSAPGTRNVICSEEAFHKLAGDQGYTIIDMQLKKNTGDEAISKIRSLTTPQMRFSDQRQSNTEGKSLFYSFSIFVYGFLLVIALITVLNIVNSINNSVSARLGQYGIMRAVGMAEKQVCRMVVLEAAAYAVCGCLAGTLLGLPLHSSLFRMAITSRWGVLWQPPYASLAIIAGVSVLTALLAVIGPVRKLSRMDIVNVVNAQ